MTPWLPLRSLPLLLPLLALPGHAVAGDALPERVTVQVGARLELSEVRVILPDGRIRVLGLDVREAIDLPPGSTVELVPGDSRRYVGRLSVEQRGEAVVAHLTLDREAYLAGVVASEMGVQAPAAALEAQAVASRTLIAHGGDRHPDDPWTFCDLTHCQSFRGVTDDGGVWRAVSETGDRVMTVGQVPVEAPFHSTCGGRTLPAAQVWGSSAPHLTGVSDLRPDGSAYCDGSPHGRWTAALVGAHLPDPGEETERFRTEVGRLHGWNLVKSNRFTASRLVWKGQLVWWLEGVGLGHGVGLCQQGAIGRARAGQGVMEILEAYFPGAEPASP